MKLPLVLLTDELPADWVAALAGNADVLSNPAGSGLSEEQKARLPDAEGILSLLTTRIDEAVLSQAPRLRVVSNMAVGVDNVDVPACTRRGIPVGNTPGVLTDATADLAMALLLAAARRLPESAADAKAGRWKTWNPTGWLGADLDGAILGIVGMGKIGQAVARRARAFGLRIAYADPSPCPEADAAYQARRLSLEQLLAESDFVSLHCPLTRETRGLIDAGRLRLMKPSAILVNTSRGPVVDQYALWEALSAGQIAFAALDVTDPEPLPPDHPLFSLPNCLIVPHIGSATRGTRRRMAEIACQNLLAGLRGERLPFCVNPEAVQEKKSGVGDPG